MQLSRMLSSLPIPVLILFSTLICGGAACALTCVIINEFKNNVKQKTTPKKDKVIRNNLSQPGYQSIVNNNFQTNLLKNGSFGAYGNRSFTHNSKNNHKNAGRIELKELHPTQKNTDNNIDTTPQRGSNVTDSDGEGSIISDNDNYLMQPD